MEGALTIAIAAFTDKERRESPTYQWLKETLREPIAAKVINLAMAQSPEMGGAKAALVTQPMGLPGPGLDHKDLPS